MAASSLLSTDALPARERAPQWCEWLSQHFGGLQTDLYGDSEFDGQLRSSHAGDVILTRLEANRHRVLRTASMVRSSDAGYLKIVAPWRGSAMVQQQGREACAREGAWVIYDTTDTYQIGNPERSDYLVVMVPKEGVCERGQRLDGQMARRLGASGISRVALEAMRNTYLELPSMREAAAQGAGESIKHLVRLSLMELSGQETALTQRKALRDRITDYIRRNLRDPRLSIDQVARALNCSKRHLHNAFADEPDTLAGHVMALRLQACRRDLCNPSLQHEPIAEIARSWGFTSGAHFSRVFRARYGQSPSECRARAAA